MTVIGYIKTRALVLITGICLCICCKAQRFTISVVEESLEVIFQHIERQSSYRFVYTKETLSHASRVSMDLKEANLGRVLEACFIGQPLTYLVEDSQVIISQRREMLLSSGDKFIRGRIVDEAGRPIVGASVVAIASGTGAASDAEGNFYLRAVRLPAIIRISGAEINAIDTILRDEAFCQIIARPRIDLLDETIVIAYGQTTKRYTTMNVEKVSREKIERQPVSNPIASLAGRVSGLQVLQGSGLPGSDVQLRIRGQNSLINGNDPLILLDGIPFPSVSLNGMFGGPGELPSSSLNNISPSDIESIEVLKDAAATAIYGSRGANGVILLTTKRGRPDSLILSTRLYIGGGRISHRIRLMNTSQYLEMRKEAFTNDGVQPSIGNAIDLLQWDSMRYTNWQRQLMGEITHVSNVNITASGGGRLTQVILSGSLHSESTAYRGEFGLARYSLAMNVTHRSDNDRLHVSLLTSVLALQQSAPREDLTRQISLPPNAPRLLLPDGNLNWEHSSWTNPLSKLLQVFTNRSTNFQAGLSADYHLVGPVILKLTAGYARLFMRELSILPTNSFDPAWRMEAQATYGRKKWQTLIAEPQVSFCRKVKHTNMEALLGGSIQQTDQFGLYQSGAGYPDDKSLSNIAQARVVSLKDHQDIRYRYLGIFARFNAQLRERYLVSATVRLDGSSRYAPARRFSSFGAMGLGWIASKEKFLQSFRFLSFAKVGVSLGKSGNDQIEDYRYLDLYDTYDFNYQGQPTYRPIQLYNPAYGWEKVMKKECSLDIGFSNNRYLLGIHYYRHQTGSLLVNYGLPYLTGFGGVMRNVPARILNTGWELQADLLLIDAGKLQWRASVNLTIPRNRLVDYPDLWNTTLATTFVVGKPLTIARTFHLEGLDPTNGMYRFTDVDGDGRITSEGDQQFVVDMSQRFFGGVEQVFKSGRFVASILLQFARQPHAIGYTSMFSRPGIRSNQPEWLESRWKRVGDEGPYQRASFADLRVAMGYANFQKSDAVFQDASYIRLRNICIDYQLSDNFCRRWGFRALSFFMQGQHLLTLTRYKGLDPETKNYMPPAWMLVVGVKMQL